MPDPVVLLPLAILAAAYLGFCYVELARRPARHLPKPVWALIITASIPVGGIVFLLVGRGESPVTETAAAAPEERATVPQLGPEPRAGARRGELSSEAGPAPATVIRTRALTKVFAGGAGLHEVELAMPGRGVYGLVGPNGAGKTTLMSLLADLRRPDSGEIEGTARVMLCPDAPSFEPWLTATETVALFAGLGPAGGLSPGEALAAVGLADVRDRRVGGFSRGMRQRLGLAVVLASGAQVLLLDEPTSALDPAGRADILRLVAELGRDRAVMVSSHILADVQRVADTIGVLREGRLIYQGPVRELIERHTRPSWRLELRSKVDEVARLLSQQDWVSAVEREAHGLRVDTTSLSAGERLLPAQVAAAGAELIALNPVGADLETVFLSMVGGRT